MSNGSDDRNPTRRQVIETVIDIFIREVGFVERQDVSPTTHVAKDLGVQSDDLTAFAMAVERHFDIRPAPEEWLEVGTIEQVADLVLRHLPGQA